MWQVDIIMVGVVALAVKPTLEAIRAVRNWLHRREAERRRVS